MTLTVKPTSEQQERRGAQTDSGPRIRGMFALCAHCQKEPLMFFSWPASRKAGPMEICCPHCNRGLVYPPQSVLEFFAGEEMAGRIAAAQRDLERRMEQDRPSRATEAEKGGD